MKHGLSCLLFFLLVVVLYEQGICQTTLNQEQPVKGFLYFIDKDSLHLKSVEKKFPAGLNSHDFGLAIIESLSNGPDLSDLKRTIPKGTKVNSLFILEDGRAFIDFDQNIRTLRHYSAQSEMLTIYSIVNSLILNIEKINRVKILIQGKTAQTLWGHIDLDSFYEANMLIVK